ncbi:putative phosphatidylinositol transfer protein CSR1 [Rosellinia necatrix]|uniref:Putative phosphatidylinositol transfer protein CSR1 n=1 Tax=Rosellinia necatrix TaxID=77044 RepID=A0A1W2TGG0_ROSNE|nr:putative phosphatidylinositol transfer protein CSR1 [Rosellinia necatrix]
MTSSSGDLPPGTLGNLTAEEEQKLQQMWIHLLRLCGVEDAKKEEETAADAAAATEEEPGHASPEPEPEPVPDLTGELRQLLTDASSSSSSSSSSSPSPSSPAGFRAGLWGFVLSEDPDALVLRFLRARKWDVGRAAAMLASAVGWRASRDMAGAVIRAGEGVAFKADPTADDRGFLAQYRSGKSYVRGADREGRLVYVIRVRLHDPRLQSGDAMEAYVLHNIESLRAFLRPPADRCCLLFDMTGFGLKNMDFHVVRFLVSVFEARYPETLGVVLIHNAPFVFWGIWNMIKGWLDPVIASKINFTRKPADLLQFIPEASLQTSYGGKDGWEYEYVEPVEGENARLDEAEKRAEIQQQRDELVAEFERATLAWARSPGGGGAKEKALRRAEVVDRLGANYWRLDPYIRARTLYHRWGMSADH